MDLMNIPTVLVAFQITSIERLNSTDTNSIVDKILVSKTFFNEKLAGSFFSCIYNGKL